MDYVGTVTKVSDVDFKGTKLWSFQIDTTDQWFRTGVKEPGVAVGAHIRFAHTGEPTDKVDPTAIEEISADEKGQAPAPVKVSAPVRGRNLRENYWQDKAEFERTMQPVWDWGRARSDAGRVVAAALTSGAIEFPKSKAVAKRLDMLVDFVHEVTQQLLEKEQEIKASHDVKGDDDA